MHRQDPLTAWLFQDDVLFKQPKGTGRVIDQALEGMEAELNKPKPDLLRKGASLSQLHGLSEAQRHRAQALYLRLWGTSAKGKFWAEEGLLSLIARAADVRSIPFWKEVMALRRSRETFAPRRRALCVAALAFAAKKKPGSAAWDTLVELTEDPSPEARRAAVEALVDLYQSDDPLSERILPILQRVAREERAFEPRFLARRFLAPLFPGEEENGGVPGEETVFAFKASFGKAHRTIEIRANQSLYDLHKAILDAFGWDSDHLFAFYLSGDRRDEKFEVPDSDESSLLMPSFGSSDDREGDGEGGSSLDMSIGAIGMGVGHKFLYLFDFGDNNLFSVEVTAIHLAKKGMKYPRVAQKVGKAPPQYRAW